MAPRNSSDGRVVRASNSGSVDIGLIPSRVKPMTLILAFTISCLTLNIRDSVENKPASLLVVPLQNALSGFSILKWLAGGRQLLSQMVVAL